MNYKSIESKELIISLIKDDLRNMRLTYGLSELGLIAEKYSLQLNRTILLLMGFDKEQLDDDIYDKYNRYLTITVMVPTCNGDDPLPLKRV